MSDPTQLIISIQGKRGSGKTTFAGRAIEPMLKAIGATLLKKTDEKNGVFLTVQVPFGISDLPPQMFTAAQVTEISREAVRHARAEGGARLCFANSAELLELLRRRGVLTDFLEQDEDGDVASKIAAQALPKELGRVLEPKSVIAMLRQDALVRIEEIDLQLEELGFDTSDRELPAA